MSVVAARGERRGKQFRYFGSLEFLNELIVFKNQRMGMEVIQRER